MFTSLPAKRRKTEGERERKMELKPVVKPHKLLMMMSRTNERMNERTNKNDGKAHKRSYVSLSLSQPNVKFTTQHEV